jgi:hypothetical protein
LELGENMEICQGDSITLDAGEGHHWYLWNTGDTIRAITVFEAGEYWVTVASEHECSISDTMMVTIHPVPSVELGKDTVLCYYHEIVLDAGNPGSTYLWSTGEDSQAITVDSTGMVAGLKTVSVDVTSADGCMSSDTIYVSFIECLSIDENAISEELQVYPNPGDGRFAITLDSDKAIKGTLILTSTSGKVVYQKKDILLVPGSHQNVNLQMLPDGVYTLHFISENKLYQKRLIIKG